MAMVKAKRIADLLGLTDRAVQMMAKRGELEAEKDEKGQWVFDECKTVQAYIGLRSSGNAAGDAARKTKADADLQEAKAAQEEIKLAELKGTMHNQEDVQVVIEEMVFTVKNILLAIPGRTAMDLASAKTALECERIVRTEIYKAMEELANHRYDPKTFKKLVMSRIKWMKKQEEEDGTERTGKKAGSARKSSRSAGKSK